MTTPSILQFFHPNTPSSLMITTLPPSPLHLTLPHTSTTPLHTQTVTTHRCHNLLDWTLVHQLLQDMMEGNLTLCPRITCQVNYQACYSIASLLMTVAVDPALREGPLLVGGCLRWKLLLQPLPVTACSLQLKVCHLFSSQIPVSLLHTHPTPLHLHTHHPLPPSLLSPGYNPPSMRAKAELQQETLNCHHTTTPILTPPTHQTTHTQRLHPLTPMTPAVMGSLH